MDILVDTHTHTIASTHAYSTIAELASMAAKKNLEAIAITDHAPGIMDAPHYYHFGNLKCVPRDIDGVKIIYGIELNLLDDDGSVDFSEKALVPLDYVICSIHAECYKPKNKDIHTGAYIKVLENPMVDAIGHSGYPEYEYHLDPVLLKAKELDKVIEINSHTFDFRKRSVENCRKIAVRCKELGVKIAVSSDAHSAWEVGSFDSAIDMLKEIDFPSELIVNENFKKFSRYLTKRKPYALSGMQS